MLRSMKGMEDYTIGATDGIIGRVRDFYFDDVAWVIRYLVVQTGERNVLISPISIGRPDWSKKVLPVSLTRKQVRDSPDIDTNKPVSRQHEMGYLGYYGYGNYWGGGGLWGAGFYPDLLQAGMQILPDGPSSQPTQASIPRHQRSDPHLRSGNAVMRYYVHATDGDIGHVEGLLVDESSWAIRYVIVDTSNWWLGHQVIVAPEWISRVDWAESKVWVDLTQQAIKDSPAYDAAAPLNREQEASIFAHYGHDGYWPREAKTTETRPRV
jgi:hypothetical protein